MPLLYRPTLQTTKGSGATWLPRPSKPCEAVRLRREATQHVVQDAAVLEVVELVQRIDADLALQARRGLAPEVVRRARVDVTPDAGVVELELNRAGEGGLGQ